jgi:hypothetical protein
MKKKAKDKPHYVNNREFSTSVVEYVNSVNEAKEHGKEEPRITEYIGTCFLKIAEGLSHKPNFYGYTYREEMVMDAVENCIKAIMNYNIEKATRTGLPNAFSYFTQISYFAFLRRIAKEKKYQDVKDLFKEHADAESFMDSDNHVDASGIVNRVRYRSQALRKRDTARKNFAKKINKTKKSQKGTDGKLDNFI